MHRTKVKSERDEFFAGVGGGEYRLYINSEGREIVEGRRNLVQPFWRS